VLVFVPHQAVATGDTVRQRLWRCQRAEDTRLWIQAFPDLASHAFLGEKSTQPQGVA
jgi:hypothetical protein